MIDPKVKLLLQQLTSAIDASATIQEAAGIVPGPGIAPTAPVAPTSASWLDNPGELYVGDGPFPASFDDIPECLRRAAQCINPNGSRAWKGDDAVKAVALARYISDPVRTYQEVEDRLVNAGKNPSVAAFALCVGWAQGFPVSMGTPTLYTVAGLIADLCSAQGTSTPSGKTVSAPAPTGANEIQQDGKIAEIQQDLNEIQQDKP